MSITHNETIVPMIIESIRSVMGVRDHNVSDFSADTVIADHLDSLALVQLVTVLEEKFRISFQYADLMSADYWRSPRTIAVLIQSKLQVGD